MTDTDRKLFQKVSDRCDELEGLLKEAGEMLKEIQWNDWNEVDNEPACAILCDRDGDHAPDCRLASLLSRISAATERATK